MAFTNVIWVQIGFIMVLCVRLLIIASEQSIKHKTVTAREDLNLPQILQDSILRAQSLALPGAENRKDRDFFLHTIHRLEGIQTWYQSLFETEPGCSGPITSALSSGVNMGSFDYGVTSSAEASNDGTALTNAGDVLEWSLPNDFSVMSLDG
ncbi:hypothetical protein N7495_003597 [Penicillium taxi]|uniref:uncharacterized protein n=1 Tax=Penicillium taxi TaxID=168475 RepID=UPI00254576BE|nr:uncharacterized protein N7495_003597 [Penicillium taxi]KAJ5898853.1 hypothetical protein N7495_003597 [Penicillium taxi]